MEKVKKITSPKDMCIGQLYMYCAYRGLVRGFCVKIEKNSVCFKNDNDWEDTIYFIKSCYPKKEYNYIAEYNARVFRYYNKLVKKHEKEIEECLEGKKCLCKKRSKEKWYKKILNRFKHV